MAEDTAATRPFEDCVGRYFQRLDRVRARLRPGDGILGMGNDPKRDGCHLEFYQEMESLAGELAGSSPPPGEATRAVELLLALAQEHRDWLADGMLEAVQGCSLHLIPLMEPGRAGELAAQYEKRYPRHRRLPVHKQVLKALKQRAGKG